MPNQDIAEYSPENLCKKDIEARKIGTIASVTQPVNSDDQTGVIILVLRTVEVFWIFSTIYSPK